MKIRSLFHMLFYSQLLCTGIEEDHRPIGLDSNGFAGCDRSVENRDRVFLRCVDVGSYMSGGKIAAPDIWFRAQKYHC